MTGTPGHALALQNVSKTFRDGTVALAGVNLQVAQGSFCVILGPSGSGKSTLLRCVNGLERPTIGRVLVGGEVVEPRSLRRLRGKIGTIHQHFGLVARDTVANNVIVGALPQVATLQALFGIFPERHKRRVCELLEAVGLEPRHLTRRVADLSGGQQQRVGIARAFMLEPGLILADEPIASLDPKISSDILTLIRDQARQRGASVVCSLHQLDLACAFADRIVALKGGRIVFDGPPGDMKAAIVADIYAGGPFVAPELAA